MKFFNYINEILSLEKTMIGFSIKTYSLSKVINHLKEILFNYNVREYEIIKDPHITIAQITSKVPKDEIIREIDKIKINFEFKPKKLKVLHGKFVPFDFITIEYKKNDNFKNIFNLLSSKFDVIRFPGGNIPHVSLIKIPKNLISDNEFFETIENLNIKLPRIKPVSIVLYNKKYEVEYEK